MTLTPEQKEVRRNKITASEIATICGLNPFERAQNVYRRKCGLAPDIEQNNAMERGHIMEGPLLEIAAKENNIVITRNDKIFVHPEHQLFSAIPDGFDNLDRTNEAKNVGKYMAPKWIEWLPHYVYCQVQWQMACTGKSKALVVANPWNEIKYFEVEYSEKVFKKLANKAYKFWDCVQKRIFPAFDCEDVEDMLDEENAPYVQQETENIVVDNDDRVLHELIMEFERWKTDIKKFKEAQNKVRELLIGRIGEHLGIQAKDMLCTFKQAKDSQIVNWERVALELNADQKLIEKHTKTKAGSRRLYVKKVRYK